MFKHVVVSLQSLRDGCGGFGCLLAHSMGLGKSIQVVALAQTLLFNQNLKRALSQGPKFELAPSSTPPEVAAAAVAAGTTETTKDAAKVMRMRTAAAATAAAAAFVAGAGERIATAPEAEETRAGGELPEGVQGRSTNTSGSSNEGNTEATSSSSSSSSAQHAVVGKTQRLDRMLIITPPTTIANWKNEFNKFSPVDVAVASENGDGWIDRGSDRDGQQQQQQSFRGRVFAEFSGSDSSARLETLDNWYHHGGVAILGYEMFVSLTKDSSSTTKPAGRPKKALASSSSSSSPEPTVAVAPTEVVAVVPRGKLTGLTVVELLATHGPDVLVLDEGHLLKNLSGARHRAVSKVRTQRKVILSGE